MRNITKTVKCIVFWLAMVRKGRKGVSPLFNQKALTTQVVDV
jgi:hypothetical protein